MIELVRDNGNENGLAAPGPDDKHASLARYHLRCVEKDARRLIWQRVEKNGNSDGSDGSDDRLREVLSAYACRNVGVGYTPSMGFLAAALLVTQYRIIRTV